jgi:hypothetical protein
MSTAAGRDPDERTPYDRRDRIMTMIEELAQSLLPDDCMSKDASRRLDMLFVAVSEALGISPNSGDQRD